MKSARNKTELKAKAAMCAAALREELRLFDDMPISIHMTLRQKNVQALFQPMSDGISGMAVRVIDKNGNVLSFMTVNTNKALGHQRFTACHELYHLLYQEVFSSVKEKTALFDEKDENEYVADWFASYLMLPKGGLERSVPLSEQHKNGISVGTLLQAEQRFRCSRAMLLFRLKDLGWIDEKGYDDLSHNVIRSAMSHGYPIELYEKTGKEEFVGNYNIKARQLFEQGRISQAKYYQLLEDIGVDLKTETEEDGEL